MTRTEFIMDYLSPARNRGGHSAWWESVEREIAALETDLMQHASENQRLRAYAVQQREELVERVRAAVNNVKAQELFEDGLSGDLHGSGITTVARAYMEGRLDALDELTTEIDAALVERVKDSVQDGICAAHSPGSTTSRPAGGAISPEKTCQGEGRHSSPAFLHETCTFEAAELVTTVAGYDCIRTDCQRTPGIDCPSCLQRWSKPEVRSLHQSWRECACPDRLIRFIEETRAEAKARGVRVPLISTDPSNTIDAFYYLMQQIEKCGASPDLTEAVVMAGDLRDRLRKTMAKLLEAVAEGATECESRHQVGTQQCGCSMHCYNFKSSSEQVCKGLPVLSSAGEDSMRSGLLWAITCLRLRGQESAAGLLESECLSRLDASLHVACTKQEAP